MKKWNTTGFYDGHQHGKNILSIIRLVKVLYSLKPGQAIQIRRFA